MTLERKIVVGLEDIEAISFECLAPDCGSRLTVAPERCTIPPRCPHCNREWVPPNQAGIQTVKAWPFVNFTMSLSKIRTLISDGQLGFRMLLEFKEPQSKVEN